MTRNRVYFLMMGVCITLVVVAPIVRAVVEAIASVVAPSVIAAAKVIAIQPIEGLVRHPSRIDSEQAILDTPCR